MNRTQKSIEDILNTAFTVSSLPLHLYFEGNYVVSCCPSAYYEIVAPFQHIAFPDREASSGSSYIWFDPDFEGIFCGLLRIDRSYSCLAGPCSTHKLSFSERRRYAMAHQIGSIQIPDGLIAKMESLFVLLCAAFHLPAEKPIIYTKGVPAPDITAANFVNYNMQQYQLTHSELGFMHHSYQIEQDTRR